MVFHQNNRKVIDMPLHLCDLFTVLYCIANFINTVLYPPKCMYINLISFILTKSLYTVPITIAFKVMESN